MKKLRTAVANFCKDDSGELTLVQAPNIYLIGWAIFLVLSKVAQEASLQRTFSVLSLILLGVWALLEMFRGDSNFRRLLGAGVILGCTISIFL